jgi:hypothetical protein
MSGVIAIRTSFLLALHLYRPMKKVNCVFHGGLRSVENIQLPARAAMNQFLLQCIPENGSSRE